MFTGIIGLEAQKRHFALTLGLPERVGVKYYFTPAGHSSFVGSYVSYFTLEDDGNDVERTEIGAGSGYRWRWRDAWDLELGLAIVYVDREEEKPRYTETETYITFLPFIAVGYSF